VTSSEGTNRPRNPDRFRHGGPALVTMWAADQVARRGFARRTTTNEALVDPAVPVTWRYAPGPGLLLGDRERWLLLADQPEESVILDLWDALTGAGLASALAVLERAYAGQVPAVAGRDARRTECRSGGAVSEEGELSVALPVEGPWLPITGGIVAGAAAQPVPGVQQGPARRLIDGIPDEIATAVGPDVPERFRHPRAPVPGDDADTGTGGNGHPDRAAGGTTRRTPAGDHDGNTAARSGPVDHLRQPTHETVLAVFCERGHPTPASSAECRVCRADVPPQDPRRIPRPRLGGLRLPGGEVVALDRSVVIGRRPAPVDGQGEWPHLVTVPAEASYVSRVHLHVELDGWLVIVRDLGSRGGTTLRVPGRRPEAMRAQEPHVLEPGHALDLADEYEVVYDVTSEPVG
jgi:FHA domain